MKTPANMNFMPNFMVHFKWELFVVLTKGNYSSCLKIQCLVFAMIGVRSLFSLKIVFNPFADSETVVLQMSAQN